MSLEMVPSPPQPPLEIRALALRPSFGVFSVGTPAWPLRLFARWTAPRGRLDPGPWMEFPERVAKQFAGHRLMLGWIVENGGGGELEWGDLLDTGLSLG